MYRGGFLIYSWCWFIILIIFIKTYPRASITIAEISDLRKSIRNDLLNIGVERFRSVSRSDFKKNLKIVPKIINLSGPRLAATNLQVYY